MTTNRPQILGGERRPRNRATAREAEQRVKAAAALQDLGFEAAEIEWYFEQAFGVGW